MLKFPRVDRDKLILNTFMQGDKKKYPINPRNTVLYDLADRVVRAHHKAKHILINFVTLRGALENVWKK